MRTKTRVLEERRKYSEALADIVADIISREIIGTRRELDQIPREGLIQYMANQYSGMSDSWRGRGYGSMSKPQILDAICETFVDPKNL